MKKASRIFSYLGTAFGFAAFLIFFLLSILGFVGAFKYLPSFIGENNRSLFYAIMLIYSLFCLGVGLFSLHHYSFEDKENRDTVYNVYGIILSVLTINGFSLVSFILSQISLNRGY